MFYVRPVRTAECKPLCDSSLRAIVQQAVSGSERFDFPSGVPGDLGGFNIDRFERMVVDDVLDRIQELGFEPCTEQRVLAVVREFTGDALWDSFELELMLNS